MDVEYRGANCVVIRDKKILIVVDPTANVSVKEAKNLDAVILATQEKFAPVREDKGDDRERNRPFVIDMPGEYEHNDVSVLGLPVHAHIDKDGKSATMYRIETDGVSLAVIGHTDAPLNDDDLESLGMVDIVIVPVGGGYTLDARDAATIVRQISPKVVIPTHFADAHVKYDIPQDSVEDFAKEMGGAHEKMNSFKAKSLPEVMTVIELARTA